MINKKKLPLKLAQDIHVLYDEVRSYARTKNDLITIKEDKELKLLLIDNDLQSDFYFTVSDPSFSGDKSYFNIEFVPAHTTSLKPHKTSTNAAGVMASIKGWIDLIEKYNTINLTPNELLINQYEDEFFSGFEIIDDDAEFISFDFPRQLLIQNFLHRTIEILNDDTSDNSEIIIEVNELKDNIQNFTKKIIVRKLSRIFAIVRKKSLVLCKKILIEAGNELFEKAISISVESVYGMIIQ